MSRVLVAEDEALLLRLMQRVLERAGYAVVTAGDGDQALRAVGEGVDALVIDARILPAGAGAVLDALLARAGRVPPVVVTSGDALAAPLSALLEEQGGVFLRKPFAPAELVRAVREAGKP